MRPRHSTYEARWWYCYHNGDGAVDRPSADWQILRVGWLGWRCGRRTGRPVAGVLVNNAIITLSPAADAGLAAIATRTALDPFSYHGQICCRLLYRYPLCQLVWRSTVILPQPSVPKSMHTARTTQSSVPDSRKKIADYFNLFVFFYYFYRAAWNADAV